MEPTAETVPGRRSAGPAPRLRRRIDRALHRIVEGELSALSGRTPEAVRDAVLSPGKRIRPLLLAGAHRAVAGEVPEAAVELACSVELVHAYSLVHDDLPCMDDDVLRRGRPTIHVRYGVRTAVLVGSSLMPMAVRVVARAGEALGLERPRIRRLLRRLARSSGGSGMVGGQLLDLRAEGRAVGPEELRRIHRGKTAALMEAAVRMGAASAGAEEELLERAGRFGRKLGLAFQAVDDILDETGDAEELGKSGGRDRALGKATYPSVMGLDAARRAARELASEARGELDGLGEDGVLDEIVAFVVRRRR